jgi:hypothetical protein
VNPAALVPLLVLSLASDAPPPPRPDPKLPEDPAAVAVEWVVSNRGRAVPGSEMKRTIRADGRLLDDEGRELGRVPAALLRDAVRYSIRDRGFHDFDPQAIDVGTPSGQSVTIRINADGKDHSVRGWDVGWNPHKRPELSAMAAILARLNVLAVAARFAEADALEKAAADANRLTAKDLAVTLWDAADGRPAPGGDGYAVVFRRALAPVGNGTGAGTLTVQVERSGGQVKVTATVSDK